MKIVLLLTDFCEALGGIAAFNRTFVQALEELSVVNPIEVTLLALNDKGSGKVPSVVSQYIAFAGKRVSFVRSALRVSRQADLVFFGHAHFAPLALLIRARRQWLVGHGIEVWGKQSFLQRIGIRRMDRVLTVSRFSRDKMLENGLLKNQAWDWFPNTLLRMPDPQPVARETLGLPKGPMLLSVSRLYAEEKYKHLDRVIEAFPALLPEFPDLQYAIAGDGDDRIRLQSLAQSLNVGDHVHFLGAVSDAVLSALYDTSDLFVLPSEGEGFGIVFLEAMAHGKACVGVRSAGVPEVIEHGVTGLLPAAGNPAELQQALETLLRDAANRQTMGAAGRKRYLEHFSFRAYRHRLGELLSHPDGKGEQWTLAA